MRSRLPILCALAAACSSDPYVIGEQLTDAGAFVDECVQQHAAALACSGFEAELGGGAEAFGSPVIEGAGHVERSTARAHTGEASLRAATSGVESVAVVSAEFGPVRSGSLHLRAHVYVAADVPTETLNLFFLGDVPTPDPFVGIDINLEQGALQIFSPQLSPARRTSTLQIPRDRWFCLRADVAVGDADGAITLRVDDAIALQETELDTLPDAGVHLLRAGIDWSSGQAGPIEIFLDDLVLDTQPVACRSAP